MAKVVEMVENRPKIPPFREVTPEGRMVIRFHEAHKRAWESKARQVFMQMGTGGGKTCFGPVWLHREIQERGAGDYLAVTATFPLLKLKMEPDFRSYFETDLKLGKWKAALKVFESHDREHGGPAWRVIFGSAAKAESLESAHAKAAWLDEVGQEGFSRAAWEAVLRRVRVYSGRILGTTTLYVWGWYKNEVFDRWKGGDPTIEVIQADSIVNPAYPREEYERARATMPRWKFNLFYRGIFERPAGLIYDSFDERVCKIKRFALPNGWPRYVGHDFGPNNTAALWYAQDPGTGYLYLYREYLRGGVSAFDHAQEFIRMSQGENVIRRCGGANHEDGWRESFTAAGWPIVKPRMREVEAGIDRVYGWHKQNRLFVFDDMVGYLDEKMSYSRKLDDNYQPTKEIDQKSSYHRMDAERYMLADFAPEVLETAKIVPVYREWNQEGPRTSKRLRRLRETRW